MQEEIEQKSATLMINGTKFSLRTLKSAALRLLAHRQNPSAPGVKHRGKQTVRQLVGQNQGVSNIELSGQDLKEFQRITRRYGVDYAIHKVDGDKLRGNRQNMMVTPQDIDQQVRDLSKVVGYGINWALQDLEIEEMNALLS